jgi:hypothetical protein
MTKRTGLKNKVRKIKNKKYRTFLDHVGVQPIPSTFSSLTLDSLLEGCFAILYSKPYC